MAKVVGISKNERGPANSPYEILSLYPLPVGVPLGIIPFKIGIKKSSLLAITVGLLLSKTPDPLDISSRKTLSLGNTPLGSNNTDILPLGK